MKTNVLKLEAIAESGETVRAKLAAIQSSARRIVRILSDDPVTQQDADAITEAQLIDATVTATEGVVDGLADSLGGIAGSVVDIVGDL